MKILCRSQLGELLPNKSIAIELGVAKGYFSRELLENNPNISTLYSVDRWTDRSHQIKEYTNTVNYLRPYRDRNIIYRASFEEICPMFSDNIFDLVYIDGYAHTGQEEGNTLSQWWPKVKKGGIFSGHDYHNRWPLTIKQVDKFVKERGLTLYLTEEKAKTPQTYPSWYVVKK